VAIEPSIARVEAGSRPRAELVLAVLAVVSLALIPIHITTIYSGLPAHPLFLHVPVILIPVAAIWALILAVHPAWCSRSAVLLGIVTVVALAATFLTVGAGEALRNALHLNGGFGPAALIARHAHAGMILRDLMVLFTGALILAYMALPTIISVAEDALDSVPRSYRDAGLAMGATRWQTIWRVVVPAGRSGILTAVMLGMGRAIGETMAVMMVTGNAAVLPSGLAFLFKPVRTMTATIAAEMGEVARGSTHYHALFGIGIILFVLTFLINLAAAAAIFQKRRRGGLR